MNSGGKLASGGEVEKKTFESSKAEYGTLASPASSAPRAFTKRQSTLSRSNWTRSFLIAFVVLVLLLRSVSLLPFSSLVEGGGRNILLPETEVVQGSPGMKKEKPFEWSDITPTKELVYHDCFAGLQCARLEVPLNYKRTDGKGTKVALAITRRPAKVPVTDPRYGGIVFIEPGGPGGSGVSLQLWLGPEIQYVVDSAVDPATSSQFTNSSDKYFDIIGWDPRGINNTTPSVNCFPDTFSSQNWKLEFQASGILGSSDRSLITNWERSRALAMGCSQNLLQKDEYGDALGEHINTTPVIEDMVQMLERHGEWREKHGLAAAQSKPYVQTHSREDIDAMLERTKWNRGEEKLQYWGFSYGTVIGATFASMHPERVSRVVLDGVCDSDDYYSGTWYSNLVDTDAILTRFFEYCSDAGPEKCPFYRAGGPDAIRDAYDTLMADIHEHPVAVPSSSTRGPYLITWSDVKLMLSPGLYQPLHLFPLVARLLNDLTLPPAAANNDTFSLTRGHLFADYKASNRGPTCPTEQCTIDGPYSPACMSGDALNPADASSAILCTDGPGLGSISLPSFEIYWSALRSQSAAMGDFWAHTRLGCVGWTAEPAWRFPGPISSNLTAHPLLFVGNTLDTVTPIANARNMALQFPGSIVLEQKAEGHCSFAAPSVCTTRHVKRYFQTGELPGQDERDGGGLLVPAVCETDLKPLLDVLPSADEDLDVEAASSSSSAQRQEDSQHHLKILSQASRKFAERSPRLHFAGLGL